MLRAACCTIWLRFDCTSESKEYRHRPQSQLFIALRAHVDNDGRYVDYCSRPARAVQCAIKTAKYWKNTVEQITLCPSQNAVGYFVRDSAGLHDTPLSNFALYSPLCGLAQWLARWLRSTKLIYAGPGYNVLRRVTVSGFNSRCRTLTSVCSQPATQGQLSFPSLRGR